MLEEETFRGKKADFTYFVLFSALCLLVCQAKTTILILDQGDIDVPSDVFPWDTPDTFYRIFVVEKISQCPNELYVRTEISSSMVSVGSCWVHASYRWFSAS
jgi:hypothetical protein